MLRTIALCLIGLSGLGRPFSLCAAEMPRVVVAEDRRGFVLKDSGEKFVPWGFNYDHDESGRLIEDYWEADWDRIEHDFAEMRILKANVVRIHLQVAKFLKGAREPDGKALERLAMLLDLAEREKLYLDLTGLGCYHKRDVPAWYDELSEADRWEAQATFWEAIAKVCAGRSVVFCYDLMNEPVVPGGDRAPGDWLGPPFAGKHFVQMISLSQKDRPRPEIARQWIARLVRAIRTHDKQGLVTVGMVDWSLDRPGLTSGFVPSKVAGELDFLCVHLYPKKGKLAEALETLSGFAEVGKPVVIEETFPLSCPFDEFEEFVTRSEAHAAGWIGFYWGKTRAEYQKGTTIADALMNEWLALFERLSKARP